VSICFSCGLISAPNDTTEGTDFLYGKPKALSKRGLSLETCRRYGYIVCKDDWGNTVQVAPYYDPASGRLVAQKVRGQDKAFRVIGKGKDMPLFGQQLVRRGGKQVVITEGEIDAMSISQALGNTWPVVSLPNGAGNLQALQSSLDLLESNERIVLCFDNDEPGQKATEAALELFSPGKAYVVDLGTHKDANDFLLEEEITAPLAMGTPFPWPKLNDMVFGFRPGELVTWTAGTGTGKTAIIGELEHYVLMETNNRLGIIHLEEGIVRSARRIIGVHMDKPIHLPNVEYTSEDFADAWDATIGSGRVCAYNHFGSIDIDVLVNRVRHLVRGLGCSVVVLDHVSMVVSGADVSADERRMLDNVVTRLKSLAEETSATIHMISHLSRTKGLAHEEGGHVSLNHLRGSQAIGQLSDTIVALERDQQAMDEVERNTTMLRVLKNRYAGVTGPADYLRYDRDTGRMTLVAGKAKALEWGEGEVADF
jgi:twinkle protein